MDRMRLAVLHRIYVELYLISSVFFHHDRLKNPSLWVQPEGAWTAGKTKWRVDEWVFPCLKKLPLKSLIGRCRQWNQGRLSYVYVQHSSNFVSLIIVHLLCLAFSLGTCNTYPIVIYWCIRSLYSFFMNLASDMHVRLLGTWLILYSSNLIKLWNLYLASGPLNFILNTIPFENKFPFIKFVLLQNHLLYQLN